MKVELPDLDNLYQTICAWDFYADIVEENVITNKMEIDKIFDDMKEKAPDMTFERVPTKFTNPEEYIRIFYDLFTVESKAQITHSKLAEIEQSEIFLLNFAKQEEKRKIFYILEFIKRESKGVNYSSGDVVLIHKLPLSDPQELKNSKQHILAVIDRFLTPSKSVNPGAKEDVLICKTILKQGDERSIEVAKFLFKNSELYITRICNLATINREYQALVTIDNLKLLDLLIHPGKINDTSINPNISEYFHIPRSLDFKLKLFFNHSQYDALKNSIKKRGLTLIQGPPGTGKSTTILGILSVILNASLKSDKQVRKDSIIMCVNQEALYNYEQLKDTGKTYYAPWLETRSDSDEDYLNHFDEPICFDNCQDFKDYPNASKTDTFKILQKPVEEDVIPPEKILVCAPSNVAVDEIIRKLIQTGLYNSEGNSYMPSFVRIGPNYHPTIKEYALDYIVNSKLNSNINLTPDELKYETLNNAKIVFSTLSMAGSIF